jgi:hypothetical protein
MKSLAISEQDRRVAAIGRVRSKSNGFRSIPEHMDSTIPANDSWGRRTVVRADLRKAEKDDRRSGRIRPY